MKKKVYICDYQGVLLDYEEERERKQGRMLRTCRTHATTSSRSFDAFRRSPIFFASMDLSPPKKETTTHRSVQVGTSFIRSVDLHVS